MNTNTPAKPPKKWKLLLISWLFAYPAINVVFALLMPFIKDLNLFVRTLCISLILVPLLGTVVPVLHKRYFKWITK